VIRFVLAFAVLFAALAMLAIATMPAGAEVPGTYLAGTSLERCPGHRTGLLFYRDLTHARQDARGARRSRYGFAHRSPGCAYVAWAADLWRDRAAFERRALAEWRRLHHVPAWPWFALGRCEAPQPNGPGVVWHYNGPSGFDGGVQFHPDTWNRHKVKVPAARGYAFAWQAPPAIQIAVARVTLAAEGWRAWPACSRKLGLR
jgi:hypothetical protein